MQKTRLALERTSAISTDFLPNGSYKAKSNKKGRFRLPETALQTFTSRCAYARCPNLSSIKIRADLPALRIFSTMP